MTEFKWADVAHYYTKSPIGAMVNGVKRVVASMDSDGSIYTDEAPSHGQGVTVYPESVEIGEYTPILRHRDDLTEEEARELYAHSEESLKDVLGDDYEPPKSYKAEIFRKVTHKGTWSFMDHILGNPRDWYKLIEWGFDVFGLIEAGEAIRKEVEK